MIDNWKTRLTGLCIVCSTYPLEFCHPLPAAEQEKKKKKSNTV